MEKPISGGCLCGAIRFRASKGSEAHLCSCDMCQKHTGALSVLWVEFAASDVEWVGEGGAPAQFRSSAQSSRAFCPRCGSSLGAIDDGPTVALLVGTFDVPKEPSLLPQYHSFEDMAPAWWRGALAGVIAKQD